MHRRYGSLTCSLGNGPATTVDSARAAPGGIAPSGAVTPVRSERMLMQPRPGTRPHPGACTRRASMTNSFREELLQPLLEVHPGDADGRRDRRARSAPDQMTSTVSF